MVPHKYKNIYIPVKYFLTSYRALSDAHSGLIHLRNLLKADEILISEWKVIWIGACAIMRSSIELMRLDSRSCINEELRKELRNEWDEIGKDRDKHKIFWGFLRHERNNIMHEYKWAAYKAWMNQDGSSRPAHLSLLDMKPSDSTTILEMAHGPYKGRDSMDLLEESYEWAQERIYGAIRRSGFDPEERRNVVTFKPRDTSRTLLSDASSTES